MTTPKKRIRCSHASEIARNIDHQQSEELKHAEQKQQAIYDWIRAHSYTHPNFDDMVRDYNVIGQKVKLLKNKIAGNNNTERQYMREINVPNNINFND